jgi:hypothetical protein
MQQAVAIRWRTALLVAIELYGATNQQQSFIDGR